MIQDDRQDRISDPLLASAMADLRDGLPHDVDWDRLRSSINSQAELNLARRRGSRRFFFAGRIAPLVAAASVAFALWLGPGIIANLTGTAAGPEVVAEVNGEDPLIEAFHSDL